MDFVFVVNLKDCVYVTCANSLMQLIFKELFSYATNKLAYLTFVFPFYYNYRFGPH